MLISGRKEWRSRAFLDPTQFPPWTRCENTKPKWSLHSTSLNPKSDVAMESSDYYMVWTTSCVVVGAPGGERIVADFI